LPFRETPCSMVCCEEFVVPAIRKMLGAKKLFRRTMMAELKGNIKDKKGRMHFMRATLEETKDGYSARETGEQGSGILMSMVHADALLVVPTETEELKEKTPVKVQVLYGFPFQEKPNLTDDGEKTSG